MMHFLKCSRRTVVAGALAAMVAFCAGGLAAANAEQELVVSQKGRQFNPSSISVVRNQSVTIVNDDADLLHHAYIESERFNFDSGDQNPGSRVQIAFTVTGDFKVLCGIHPKMKLLVHVQ